MSIPADLAAEQALWLAIAQDPPKVLEELRQSGLRREWFTNQTLRAATTGAMRLHLQSKDVNLLALMSHCNDIGKPGWEHGLTLLAQTQLTGASSSQVSKNIRWPVRWMVSC